LNRREQDRARSTAEAAVKIFTDITGYVELYNTVPGL